MLGGDNTRVCLALRDVRYRGYHLKTLFKYSVHVASSSLTVHLYTINGAPRVWAEICIYWAQNTDETFT